MTELTNPDNMTRKQKDRFKALRDQHIGNSPRLGY